MSTIDALKWQIFEQSCESLGIRCPSKVLSRVFLKQTFFFLCWVDFSSELKHSLLEGGGRIIRPRVFIRVSIAMINHHDQKQHGERGVYFSLLLSGHALSLKEVKAATHDRKLEIITEAKAQEMHCLLTYSACFHTVPRTSNISVALPTVCWDFPQQ